MAHERQDSPRAAAPLPSTPRCQLPPELQRFYPVLDASRRLLQSPLRQHAGQEVYYRDANCADAPISPSELQHLQRISTLSKPPMHTGHGDTPDCVADTPPCARSCGSLAPAGNPAHSPEGAELQDSGVCTAIRRDEAGVPLSNAGMASAVSKEAGNRAALLLDTNCASRRTESRHNSASAHELTPDVGAAVRCYARGDVAGSSHQAAKAHQAPSTCASHPIAGQLSEDSASAPSGANAHLLDLDATPRAAATASALPQRLLTPDFLGCSLGASALEQGLLSAGTASARSAPLAGAGEGARHPAATPPLDLSAVLADRRICGTDAASPAVDAAALGRGYAHSGSLEWVTDDTGAPVLRRCAQHLHSGVQLAAKLSALDQAVHTSTEPHSNIPAWLTDGGIAALDEAALHAPGVADNTAAELPEELCPVPTQHAPLSPLTAVADWTITDSSAAGRAIDQVPSSIAAQPESRNTETARARHAEAEHVSGSKAAPTRRRRGKRAQQQQHQQQQQQQHLLAEGSAAGALGKLPISKRAAPPPFKTAQALPAPFLTPEELERNTSTPPPGPLAHGGNALCPPLVCTSAAGANVSHAAATRLAAINCASFELRTLGAAQGKPVSRNLASNFHQADLDNVGGGLLGVVMRYDGAVDPDLAELVSPRFAGEKVKAYEDSPHANEDRDMKSPRVHAAC